MKTANIMLAIYEPDIAANTGAMLRTCACFCASAAIIEPAGFVFSDARFRRAGMDYLDAVSIHRHTSFSTFESWRRYEKRRLILLTPHADVSLWDFSFERQDVFMVGRESVGVPEHVEACADVRVRIPINPVVRSLNVAVAAAIVLAEASRQLSRDHPL